MTPTGRFVGTITGTSMDGLDIAMLDIQPGTIQVLAARTAPLPKRLRETLKGLAHAHLDDEIEALGEADTELGRFTGDCIMDFLRQQAISPRDVAAIGSHGQTVRHRPGGGAPFTLQIGDPNRIAERTGITTVADFRRRDMAAGGQGAPLVPPFHQALFGSSTERRTIVNIGGIANITVLTPNEAPRGHDTGPGNALLDAWCELHTGEPYDADGRWARSGTVSDELLQRLLADPFLSLPPPKSTGKEHYNLAWLQQHLDGIDLASEDVEATLVAFTAQTIARDIPGDTGSTFVCGGGRLNGALMGELAQRLAMPVAPTEALGADGDAIEAAAFAWLAYRRINGLPGNAPAVTGAAAERVLGAIYAP